ncbi:MAG: AAA family ATPase [Myxococcaceae bacterium]
MLRRFYVDNFRCLVNFEFRPARVNLIVGKNGSGKSTLFDAIKVIAGLLDGASVQTTLLAESLPWWDIRREQRFELDLEDAGVEFSYKVVVRHQPNRGAAIVEERFAVGGIEEITFEKGELRLPSVPKGIPYQGGQSVLGVGLSRTPTVVQFLQCVGRILLFRLDPWSFDIQATSENRMLNVNGSNLVAFLRHWSQADPEAFLDWKKRVAADLPQFNDVQLREVVAGARMLVGVKRFNNTETSLNLASFSEGERVRLALDAIAGVATPAHVVALDEPDNFLAPTEIQPILRRLTLETPRSGQPAQTIIVTHHPESIDYLASHVTWLFEKDTDGLARIREKKFDRNLGERPTDSLLADLN